MQAAECRGQLARMMSEESSALQELVALLDREYRFLQDNDVAALEGAARERQRCVARIVRIDETRRELCTRLGKSADPQGLEQLLRWCDPQHELASGWAQCCEAAIRCRLANDRNGALVAARLKHVQARLGTLLEGRRDAVTYGPRGACSQASSGRVLTTQV
ncbi:MAG: flagellar protein FlgN [Sinobacteraceae bacterium]|nr:flagellar protein FlgN [Nevskiaceae bacterium]